MLLTREQLQDRLIALHRASLELVKDVSLDRLLERIAAAACEQAEARYAALGVLDDSGKLKQFVTVGMTDAEIQKMAHPPVGAGLIGELMDTQEPLRVPVIAEHPRSAGFPPHHPLMTSFLGVPIRAADRQLGQIYLTNKLNGSEFTADDEQIIQMLAAYAAAAIQNARLVEHMKERDVALTRRNVDMALLNGIASTLTSSLELNEILNKTLGQVMNYLRVEAGEIFLLEEDHKTLRMVLHRGQAAEAFWSRSVLRVGEGPVGMAAQRRAPIVVGSDAASDGPFLRDAVKEAGFQHMACLPLISGDRLMGVMSVAGKGGEPMDERTLQLLTAVGAWAGLAIENARLHEKARGLAVLEERERIGMDLHDGIIQSIYGVGLALQSAQQDLPEHDALKQRIQEATEGLNQAIRDIRAYILDLRPRQLGNDGLIGGLRRLALEYRANTLSDVGFTGTELDLKELPHSHALALFHICQEALANAAKHARAPRVQVAVLATTDRVLLEVRDDGRGFDLASMPVTLGHGLANMQTRARAVGGEVDITSSIGEGTTVLAWVPRGLK